MPPATGSSAPLWKKLQLRPGARIALKHAPESARAALDELPAGASLCDPEDGRIDAVLVFISRVAQLEAECGEILPRLSPDAALWFAYPKAGQLETDISRDSGWDALKDKGWKPVRQIAIDSVWTALRFRKAG